MTDPDFARNFEELIEECLEDEIDLSMPNNYDLISNLYEEPTPSSANLTNSKGPTEKASPNVVVRLSRMIPRRQNYKLYFDSFFTSFQLLENLKDKIKKKTLESVHLLSLFRSCDVKLSIVLKTNTKIYRPMASFL